MTLPYFGQQLMMAVGLAAMSLLLYVVVRSTIEEGLTFHATVLTPLIVIFIAERVVTVRKRGKRARRRVRADARVLVRPVPASRTADGGIAGHHQASAQLVGGGEIECTESHTCAGSAGGAMLPFTGGDVILTVVALLTVLFAVLAGT